jgi:hypothetical protein
MTHDQIFALELKAIDKSNQFQVACCNQDWELAEILRYETIAARSAAQMAYENR